MVLAETSRPRVVLETGLPQRHCIPVDDVLVPLGPSPRRSVCAYKGEATYLAWDAGGAGTGVAWTSARPLRDAAELTGLVAFFDEAVDVVVDGVLRDRPVSPWSQGPERGRRPAPGRSATMARRAARRRRSVA